MSLFPIAMSEDPYKSMGIITLKIENVSRFPTSGPDSPQYSDVVYIQGLPWKICAQGNEEHRDYQNDNEPPLKCISCVLECNTENTDPDWSCRCVAMISIKELANFFSFAEEKRFIFSAEQSFAAFSNNEFKYLMNTELGNYDEDTDSVVFYVYVIAQEPRGLKNVPDLVYTQYSIRSEHSLFVEFFNDDGKRNNYCTSDIMIENKACSFTYSPSDKMLLLEMAKHNSDTRKIIAECIFWFWNGKEVQILKKTLHAFGEADTSTITVSTTNLLFADAVEAELTKLGVICCPSHISDSDSTKEFVPVNRKFNVVIRLMDKRIASENSVESYYGDYDCGLETVTLTIADTEASFTVPKVDLFRASPVFRRMFTVEMKEKVTGKVEEIPDTNPDEFGDFLKAISPRQEHPNPSNVLGLLKLVHLYECQTLLDRCEKHLMNCVEIPLWDLLTYADLYGLNKLQMNLVTKLNVANVSTLQHITKPHITLGSWFRNRFY